MSMATVSMNLVTPCLRIRDVMHAWRTSYTKWCLYRRTLAELRALDQREIADLGLAPGALESIAAKAVYKTQH